MKKQMILAALLCAATAATTVRAADTDAYLYWMVNLGDTSEYAFSYATIKVAGSDTYLSMYTENSTVASGTRLYGAADSGNLTTEAGFTGVGGYSGSTFLVELWASGTGADGSDTRVAWGSLAYAALSGYVYTEMGQGGAKPYEVTASQVVPEPTSGLLALLGLAALALRRKQTRV